MFWEIDRNERWTIGRSAPRSSVGTVGRLRPRSVGTDIDRLHATRSARSLKPRAITMRSVGASLSFATVAEIKLREGMIQKFRRYQTVTSSPRLSAPLCRLHPLLKKPRHRKGIRNDPPWTDVMSKIFLQTLFSSLVFSCLSESSMRKPLLGRVVVSSKLFSQSLYSWESCAVCRCPTIG